MLILFLGVEFFLNFLIVVHKSSINSLDLVMSSVQYVSTITLHSLWPRWQLFHNHKEQQMKMTNITPQLFQFKITTSFISRDVLVFSHWLSVVTSSRLIIARSPQVSGSKSNVVALPSCNGLLPRRTFLGFIMYVVLSVLYCIV